MILTGNFSAHELQDLELKIGGSHPAQNPNANGPLKQEENREKLNYVASLNARRLIAVYSAMVGEAVSTAIACHENPTIDACISEMLRSACQQAAVEAGIAATAARAALEPPAIADLEYILFERLRGLLYPLLLDEFSAHSAAARALTQNFLGLSGPPPADNRVQQFLQYLRGGRLKEILLEPSDVARRLSVLTENWISMATEFLQRLSADRADINDLLFVQNEDTIVSILNSGSDYHNNGRLVLVVVFSGGGRICYKPRSLEIDNAWQKLLHWLATKTAPESCEVPQVLCRRTYGWAKWVSHSPCNDLHAIERFYQRCGATLALLQITSTTDMHHDNLVAKGEIPVLIDVETSLWSASRATTVDGHARQIFHDSVLACGFLPYRMQIGDCGFDVGGLVASSGMHFSRERTHRSGAYEFESREPDSDRHVLSIPVIGDKVQLCDDYTDSIVSGYERMIRFLRSNEEEIYNAENGILKLFCNINIRVVLRPTYVYHALLQRSLERKRIGSLFAKDDLASLPTAKGLPSIPELAIDHETLALRQMDIPYFYTCSAQRVLCSGYSTIDNEYFEKAPFSHLLGRRHIISDVHLQLNVALIRDSVARGRGLRRGLPDQAYPGSGRSLGGSAALEAARAIGAKLVAYSVNHEADVLWFGPTRERGSLGVIGEDFYGGRVGISLFFAALYKLTREIIWRDISLRALPSILKKTNRAICWRQQIRKLGGGIGSGVAGIVYALHLIGELLSDRTLTFTARQGALELLKEKSNGSNIDLLSGEAGTILGILAVGTMDSAYAELLGRRAVQLAIAATLECDVPAPQLGFAHGLAGVGHVLARLHSVLGCQHCKAASELVRRRVYGVEPAHRECSIGGTSQRWCDGHTGIALGWIETSSFEDVQQASNFLKRIAIATEETVENDSICCGFFGRIEVLLSLSRRGVDGEALFLARSLAVKRVSQAERQGGYAFNGVDALNPGLFNGLAGVGYQLLRVHSPNQIPPIVLL